MKKITLLYISVLLAGVLLLYGGYVIVSFAVKTYTILQEENDWKEISIVAKDTPNEDIARKLMIDWLEIFTKREYVSAIDSYTIHSISIEEEHDTHFIFSARYSIVTDDPETNWKNEPHTAQNGILTFERTFRVNKVGDTYYFRIV